MKKTIKRADGVEEVYEGTPAEFRELEGGDPKPPVQFVPAVKTTDNTSDHVGWPVKWPDYKIDWQDQDECAFSRLAKAGYNGPIGMVCYCRRCSPWCVSAGTVSSVNNPAVQ